MSEHRLRLLILPLVATLLAVSATMAGAQTAGEKDALPFVAVTAIVLDASIDALYTGMTDALREAGFRDGDTVRLRFESARADAVRAAELVRTFERQGATVIVALSEPSARIAAAERLRVPLVIAGIEQATANEIRRKRKARLVTGIVNADRFDSPLALIREFAPNVRTVAIPVGVDDPAGEDAIRSATAFARGIDLTIEQLPVSIENGSIGARIDSFSAGRTAIFLDRRIFPDAPVEQIIAAAEAANLLVFASDEDTVVRGALAAIVTDSYGTGLQIGRLVARILRDPSAARTMLQPAEPTYVVINQDTASRAGLEIPETILARRGRIIGWADIEGPRPRGKPAAPEPPSAAFPATSEETEEPDSEQR